MIYVTDRLFLFIFSIVVSICFVRRKRGPFKNILSRTIFVIIPLPRVKTRGYSYNAPTVLSVIATLYPI